MKLQIKSIITTLMVSLTLTACGTMGEDDDCTKHSLVSEATTLAAGVKSIVAEYYEKNGSFPSSNAQAGLPESNKISDGAVDSLTISSGGEIIVRMNDQVNAGAELKFTPTIVQDSSSLAFIWKCQAKKMESRWLPPECRE